MEDMVGKGLGPCGIRCLLVEVLTVLPRQVGFRGGSLRLSSLAGQNGGLNGAVHGRRIGNYFQL